MSQLGPPSGLTPPSAQGAKPPPVQTGAASAGAVNRNPLTASGILDEVSFSVTVIALIVVISLLTHFIKVPLNQARVALDLRSAIKFYGIWFFVSSCGFWLVTNAFVKRWKAILGHSEMPKFLRTMLRLALLSPLFSIWLTALSCFFTKWGPFEDDMPRLRLLTVTLVSFLIFHCGFLVWSCVHGDLRIDRSGLHLNSSITARESLVKILPADGTQLPILPDEKFAIHIFPYLTPSMKVGVSVYGDFQRVRLLYQAVTEKKDALCKVPLGYLGVQVDDCFFYNYRKLAESSPFVSPFLAVLFEGRYRQQTMSRTSKIVNLDMTDPASLAQAASGQTSPQRTSGSERGPLGQIAPSLLVFSNILTAIEPGPMLRERSQLLSPRGLLPFFGSPEIVMLEFGQDAQHVTIAKQILPMLEPQLQQMINSTHSFSAMLTPKAAQDLQAEVDDLSQRLFKLRKDPLFLKK